MPDWRNVCAVLGLTFTGCICTLSAAKAQDQARKTAVLELYTSQGCKSCPQADDNFADYADDPSVVALSFHVNYWDYMGWRDTLATQDNTDRQKAYRNSFSAGMIYTPQAVINGRTEVNGREAASVKTALDSSKLDVKTAIRQLDDGRLSIEIGAGEKPESPVHVVVFYFRDSVTIPIRGGENAGQALTYRNTVSEINTIGMWDGTALKVELPASELKRKNASGCAVILQETRPDNSLGPIHGAAVFTEKARLGL
ncbi:thioredoxin family protein [Brucella sp. BE17]|uniref:DUF1223 domain-containing protein n=1 Tax=Brucella sp. BE17 TaxID=3142977 RepID=UPI0031B9C71B